MSDISSQPELRVEPGTQVLHVDGVPVVELIDPPSKGELRTQRILIVEGYDEAETVALTLLLRQSEGDDNIVLWRSEDMREEHRTLTVRSDEEINGVARAAPDGLRKVLLAGRAALCQTTAVWCSGWSMTAMCLAVTYTPSPPSALNTTGCRTGIDGASKHHPGVDTSPKSAVNRM